MGLHKPFGDTGFDEGERVKPGYPHADMASPLQPLFLLHDEPIAGHSDNYFEPDPFATTVARAALGTKGPFTIGVYGACRHGETYLIKHAKDRRG